MAQVERPLLTGLEPVDEPANMKNRRSTGEQDRDWRDARGWVGQREGGTGDGARPSDPSHYAVDRHLMLNHHGRTPEGLVGAAYSTDDLLTFARPADNLHN